MTEKDTTLAKEPTPLLIICEPVANNLWEEDPTSTPSAPNNTAESITFRQTRSLTVAPAKWITIFDATDLDTEELPAEIKAYGARSHAARQSILAADGKNETTVSTCPRPPPYSPVHWEDTYIDVRCMQRSQVVVAIDEAVRARSESLAITIVKKSKKEEDDLFMNIPLEVKNETEQETEAEGHDIKDEPWEFACGFGSLDRWWKKVYWVNSRS